MDNYYYKVVFPNGKEVIIECENYHQLQEKFKQITKRDFEPDLKSLGYELYYIGTELK